MSDSLEHDVDGASAFCEDDAEAPMRHTRVANEVHLQTDAVRGLALPGCSDVAECRPLPNAPPGGDSTTLKLGSPLELRCQQRNSSDDERNTGPGQNEQHRASALSSDGTAK